MVLNLKVSSLITSKGEWDLHRLNELFPPCDVTKIRSFPPATRLQDRLVLAHTKNGAYLVKSGNWVLTREAEAMDIVLVNIQEINKIKEKIWTVRTAPKICLFLWRALSGALAVAECLKSHGLHINPLCQLSKMEEETISHVLFRCTLASQVWDSTNLPLRFLSFNLREYGLCAAVTR